ncbi:hypothetical protein BVX98_01345 [bacterium F11]|nr:hypothetical protein BVX98_01345 [bacterium F11]
MNITEGELLAKTQQEDYAIFQTVSVIIPTFNNGIHLGSLLSQLEKQSYPKEQFEVIVVDDGSTDETQQILALFGKNSQLKPNLIKQNNQGPGAARNRGAQEAKGKVLVFLDSDCSVSQDWLEQLVQPFSDQDVSQVGGRELPHVEDSFLSRCFWFTMNSKWTTGGIRGSRGVKLGKYFPRSFNMAVRTDSFRSVGGFHQAAIYGEDIELSYLVKSLGGKTVFREQAHVYHRKKVGFLRFAWQVFQIGRARFWLGKNYPPLAEPVYFLPAIWLLSLLLWGGGILYGINSILLMAIPIVLFSPFLLSGISALFTFKNPLAFGFVFFGGIIQIVGYGLGFLSGILNWILKEKIKL